MSTNTTILLAALILGAAIVVATVVASNDEAPVPLVPEAAPYEAPLASSNTPTEPGLRTASNDERIAQVERDLEAAREELRRLRAGSAGEGDGPAPGKARSPEEIAKVRARFFELSEAYALGAATKQEMTELFELTKDKALMERVVADLASQIDEDPSDLDTRMRLAEVQAARVHSAESITERSMIGKDIRGQLTAILERDPEHWDARFMQAVGISHSQRTPQGRARAIEAFEGLISIQQSRPAEPRYAETYSQLAQVHLAERDTGKARAALEAGLVRYPGNADLKQMLDGLGQ